MAELVHQGPLQRCSVLYSSEATTITEVIHVNT